jgi:hypothetical protein
MKPVASPSPALLRVLIRLDFVAAVLLTVLAPLTLLGLAVQQRNGQQLRLLLRYWRASSLLMITVYLLAGERRSAFPAGVAARLLLARMLLARERQKEETWFQRWQRLAGSYCLGGALLTAPMLRALFAIELPPLCRAYIEPTQEFAALLHPTASTYQLGRAGKIGLALFFAGALVQLLVDARTESKA